MPIACLCAVAAEAQERRLRDVSIETRNVFDQEEADNWFYRVLNYLHVPTKTEVVDRVVWFERGEPIDEDDVAQLERVLRRTRWFGEAEASLVDVGDDEVDLVIDTRDRFSLVAAGTLSFVGGEARVQGTLGELNLFGTGKSLVADFRRDDEDSRASVSYVDPQIWDGRHRLSLSGGSTDEGPFGSIDFRRPFWFREDPRSYGVNARFSESDADYFERGNTVASVPLDSVSASGFFTFAKGTISERETLGASFGIGRTEYEAARGVRAADIRVPGDTDTLTASLSASFDRVDEFRKVRQLDSLDFVEDLRLGVDGSIRGGAVLRAEDGRSTQFQPLASSGLRAALSPWDDTYVTAAASGSVRWYGDRPRGWSGSGALHVFNQSLPSQTLAASVTFDAAFESQDLPPLLTLGEDNGLRGYPAREFAGSRFVRLNLEDRIMTPVEILSFHVGLVGFFDAGWVHSTRTGLSMSDSITSAGFGIRIGSSNILGRRPLRIDFAWPLDEVRGEEYDFSISFASGQVFSFFGNSSIL